MMDAFGTYYLAMKNGLLATAYLCCMCAGEERTSMIQGFSNGGLHVNIPKGHPFMPMCYECKYYDEHRIFPDGPVLPLHSVLSEFYCCKLFRPLRPEICLLLGSSLIIPDGCTWEVKLYERSDPILAHSTLTYSTYILKRRVSIHQRLVAAHCRFFRKREGFSQTVLDVLIKCIPEFYKLPHVKGRSPKELLACNASYNIFERGPYGYYEKLML